LVVLRLTTTSIFNRGLVSRPLPFEYSRYIETDKSTPILEDTTWSKRLLVARESATANANFTNISERMIAANADKLQSARSCGRSNP